MTPAKKDSIIRSAKSGLSAGSVARKHRIPMASAASYVARHNPKNADSWKKSTTQSTPVTDATPIMARNEPFTLNGTRITIDTSVIDEIVVTGNSPVSISFNNANTTESAAN